MKDNKNKTLSAIIHFFKVRHTARPFNIYKEQVCDKGKNGRYWIGYDGVIYFGNPCFIFFRSSQNDWWLKRDTYNKQINQ